MVVTLNRVSDKLAELTELAENDGMMELWNYRDYGINGINK